MDSHGTMSRRTALRLGALGAGSIGLGLTLAGCSTGGSSSPATASSVAKQLSASYNRPIVDLNPLGASNVEGATLLASKLLYTQLVVKDKGKFQPAFATKWEQKDPVTWVFHLRTGVRTPDDAELTAEDAAACLETIAKSTTPQAPLWATLKSAVATDPKTLTITTTQPMGTVLTNLALLSVVPKDKIGDQSFFAKPVGSGPYQVSSFTPSDHLNLTRTSGYWGQRAATAQLMLPYIPEDSTRITSLQSGDLDLTWVLPPDQIKQIEGDSSLRIDKVSSDTIYFNWFNCSRKPFTDARVRQAMWMAIDMKTVVGSLFGDTAEVASAPIPSAVFGYAKQSPYPYDPAKAKTLLKDAGYPNGFATSVMWSEGQAPQLQAMAQAFQTYWQKIGVTVTLEQLEQAAWLKRLLALDWDMDFQANGIVTGDADYALGRLYTSQANRMGYSNKQLDGILAEARSNGDQSAREKLYAQACKIIWSDAVGIYPLQPLTTYGMRKNVQGLIPAANEVPNLATVSLTA